MADLLVETPEGVALRFELAGPGTRILAAAIDGLLFCIAFFGTLFFLRLVGLDFGVMLLASGLVLLVGAYWFLFSVFLAGRTPGKLWVGIRVSDAQGFVPRATQLFLRALFVPLEAFLIVPVPVVWVLVAATPRRQRLGDLVAGTLVVRERARRAPREPVPELRWSKLETRTFALDPAAARSLSGRDLGLLRALLTRADLERGARARLYELAARRYARRLGLSERGFTSERARTFLRELFLLLREVRSGEGPTSAVFSRRERIDPSAASAGGGRRASPAGVAAVRDAPRASGSAPR